MNHTKLFFIATLVPAPFAVPGAGEGLQPGTRGNGL
jgi:hypothetical protein